MRWSLQIHPTLQHHLCRQLQTPTCLKSFKFIGITEADVIGSVQGDRVTRGKKVDYREMLQFSCFVSVMEPKDIKIALEDEFWLEACQEKLNEFTRNELSDLVPKPHGVNDVVTKWIFKNKSNEDGNTTRNKARLVAQGYSQMEGINFDETFAPVTRLESIRLVLGIACVLNIKLYQMDVKSAFLNDVLQEEVFVAQPKGFEDPHKPNSVYRLNKALYGLKQAPRACSPKESSDLLKEPTVPVLLSLDPPVREASQSPATAKKRLLPARRSIFRKR
ncbi:unnamed protein product [Microthlaspi erraticum]|uniref:Reverse transcriptase Ty1/copia-type domain-containing protein n=1 Tax=Microthlaspi erraticum TaxID=1685480 RepID=A0A6D2IJ86_9BRAS|nr:unnamed protein product [Microthlaspi erraticum]